MAADMKTRPTEAFAFGHEGPVNIRWNKLASTYVSDDPRAKASSLFELRATNGYMPTHHPLTTLPEPFGPLDSLLRRMPAKLRVENPRPGQELVSEDKGLLFVGDRVEPPAGSAAAAELKQICSEERSLIKELEAVTETETAETS